MKVLVIPDIHLKPWIFDRAEKIIKDGKADRAVCLMDIPDDWNMEFQIERNKETFDRAIAYAMDYPDTLWCYGNHDVSYPWGRLETGYSPYAERTVISKLEELENSLKSPARSVKTSDAKLFLIKLQQEDGKSYSSIHTIRGVLRPAFQMAVDDDILVKNPFGFQLAGVLVNDAVTREAISKDQMRKFLKFVHDDVVYCKYYEVVYILFHTGMRISEFCGLTLKDIDLENRTVNIDHQLQRTSDMRYIIETTKTDAGTRVLPITEDVAQMFQAIIEDRNAPKVEKSIDGYSGFLFYDDNGMPLVAMHWQHRFNHMVGRYNDIYRVQMPNITPHVCRHTYCSNMAKSGMNPKTLQYLMGHSDISVTMNVYTHIGFNDAEEELKRMEEFRKAQAEVEQKKEKTMSQKMFKVI